LAGLFVILRGSSFFSETQECCVRGGAANSTSRAVIDTAAFFGGQREYAPSPLK